MHVVFAPGGLLYDQGPGVPSNYEGGSLEG